MNKVVRFLPRALLKKYVEKNFSLLTEEDFFDIVKTIDIPATLFTQNKELSRNSKVFSYMLDKDMDSIFYFDNAALSDECINKIVNLNTFYLSKAIDRFPILMNNKSICKKILLVKPEYIRLMSPDFIDSDILTILEDSNYIPSEHDLMTYNILQNSEILMFRAIEKNPKIILKFNMHMFLPGEIEKYVKYAIEKGIIITKEDLVSNSTLIKNNSILLKVFENDPSAIVYFSKVLLNEKNIKSAIDRGYIACEEDLIKNNLLCKESLIMEPAIKNNPQLILYVADTCYINPTIIQRALNDYHITEEDILKHPNLAGNPIIMNHLPHFRNFYPYMDKKEKKDLIVKALSENKGIKDLHFLSPEFGGNNDVGKLSELVETLNFSVYEKDIKLQNEYFSILDKTVDGIISIKYNRDKYKLKYPDIVSLNDEIYHTFIKANDFNDDCIKTLANDIYEFKGRSLYIESICDELKQFYD